MNNKQDFLKTQSCVLKVNIHCDGCKSKVRKILNKVDGVYTTSIDSEQGKVTVTGNVDPVVLIKKLEKNGKHAELWGVSKGGANQNNQFMNQFMKNFSLDGGKIGKDYNDNKAKKGGKEQPKGGQLQQHGHPQAQQQLQNLQFLQKLQQQQQMKGANMGSGKDQKTVKFNLPEDEFDDDDEFDDEFDDEYDDDDELDDEIYGHLQHQSGKSIPIIGKDVKGGGGDKKGGNGGGGDKKGKEGGKKGGGGGDSGGGGGMTSIFKGILGGGGGNTEKKKDKDGKKDGKKGDKNKGGGGESGKNYGGFDGKCEKSGGFDGKGGKSGPNGGGKKSANDDGFPQMGQMGQAAAGLRAMPMMGGNGGGGFNPGMGPGQSPNPGQYNPQQQQYMAMMMNQQRMNGGDGYGMMRQPMNASSMMYGRPPMGVGYGPPMVPPPGYHDPYTSYFSDENTESCSIM
ncbi:heavy metal-associated isoprenylated plant protein 32 [Amaranthus tricolor]|uniref:heavy metal-associated isoprenylated plant protein 32 n=1 Tax=Amaranthus tricolor TaxID=29722 RepID=UPI002583BE97|nr:heavy metal-associated isoprenylated plant protein 32 [Amaranthus tricolor]